MEPILIAGAGYLGGHLARRLAREGRQVVAITRHGLNFNEKGLAGISADLRLADELHRLPPRAGAIVFTAAPDAHDESSYRETYLSGISNLIGKYRFQPQIRLIFTSSTSVYGQNDGSRVDEKSPALPSSFRGKVMLEAELLVAASPFRSTSVRLSGLYGPGRDRLIRSVRDKKAIVPSAPHFTNRIHRDDAAGIIQHLLALESPAPLYLASDDEPADKRDVLRWMAERLDVKLPVEVRRDQRSEAAGGKRCDNSRIKNEGYRFMYPSYREGYADLL